MGDPATKPAEFHVLGFVVKASVKGKKDYQKISEMYVVRSAAETYAEIARKGGFSDAFVSAVTGIEGGKEKKRRKGPEPR